MQPYAIVLIVTVLLAVAGAGAHAATPLSLWYTQAAKNWESFATLRLKAPPGTRLRAERIPRSSRVQARPAPYPRGIFHASVV